MNSENCMLLNKVIEISEPNTGRNLNHAFNEAEPLHLDRWMDGWMDG